MLCDLAMAENSKACFTQRATECGVSNLLPQFVAKGWDTMGNFAFSCGSAPGVTPSDEPFLENVVDALGADRGSSAEVTGLRRLSSKPGRCPRLR